MWKMISLVEIILVTKAALCKINGSLNLVLLPDAFDH